MKLSINTSKFAVYDDILEEKDFKDVWKWVQQQDYNVVNNSGWVNYPCHKGRGLSNPK